MYSGIRIISFIRVRAISGLLGYSGKSCNRVGGSGMSQGLERRTPLEVYSVQLRIWVSSGRFIGAHLRRWAALEQDAPFGWSGEWLYSGSRANKCIRVVGQTAPV